MPDWSRLRVTAHVSELRQDAASTYASTGATRLITTQLEVFLVKDAKPNGHHRCADHGNNLQVMPRKTDGRGPPVQRGTCLRRPELTTTFACFHRVDRSPLLSERSPLTPALRRHHYNRGVNGAAPTNSAGLTNLAP